MLFQDQQINIIVAFPTCHISPWQYYVLMIWSYQGRTVAGAGTACLCVVVTGLRVPLTVCPGVFERASEDDDSPFPLAGYRCALYLQDEHSMSPSMQQSQCDLTYLFRSSRLKTKVVQSLIAIISMQKNIYN